LAAYFVLYQVAISAVYLIDARLNILGREVGSSGWAVGALLTPILAFGLAIVFIYDAAKLTHRVVGPLYRFRKTVQAITAGGEVPLVNLRNGDYLLELRDDFNDMLRALEQRGAVTLTGQAPKPVAAPEPATV
jgi:hypothetical protein